MASSPPSPRPAHDAAPGRERIADQEASYRLLVDSVADYAIFQLDPAGYILTWNRGANRLKGYEAHEIIGEHFSRLYTAEAAARGFPAHALKCAEADGRFEDEGWRMRKDGTTFWANVVITALRTPDGRLAGFGKVTRDLTDRRRNEEALRRGEERFRLLVEGIKDYAIYMLDVAGRVVSWNTGAATIKGYRREEIIGQHYSTFYSAEDVAAGKPQRLLRQARERGQVQDEGWRVRKDGTVFWANVSITALHDEAGTLRGFAKVTRDMTERKRLEELEASSRRMTEFLATFAHELRNPLATARNAVSVMQLETGMSARVARCRDLVDRQVDHLSRLVDDLLDVGRITAGKIELRLARVDLRDVIASSVEGARGFTDPRGQTIEMELPPFAVEVNGDATRLVQVMQNLLHNASKFSPAGGRIDVDLACDERSATVSVRDFGCGIAPEAIHNIFNLFEQGEQRRHHGESGLGIGLTLCRSLIGLHGGSIFATSAGRQTGSTFSFSLPLLNEDAAASVTPRGPATGDDRRRVMVIDDNHDAADTLRLLLEMQGHEVSVAYDGAQGVAAATAFVPDVVLVDLAMPGPDGFEVLRELRARSALAGARIVAMTGFGQPSDLERTRQAGFDQHVVKPVSLDTLREVLQVGPATAAGGGAANQA